MSTLTLTLILAAVLALVQLIQAVGTATVTHYCPFTVYCACVIGFDVGDSTPQTNRPTVEWIEVSASQSFTWQYDVQPLHTALSIQCTRNPNGSKPKVTQLEFAWRPDQSPSRIWFDVSNIEGEPFVHEGIRLRTSGQQTEFWDTCMGSTCTPGDSYCGGIYDHPNDDQDSVRCCPDADNISLDLCRS